MRVDREWDAREAFLLRRDYIHGVMSESAAERMGTREEGWARGKEEGEGERAADDYVTRVCYNAGPIPLPRATVTLLFALEPLGACNTRCLCVVNDSTAISMAALALECELLGSAEQTRHPVCTTTFQKCVPGAFCAGSLTPSFLDPSSALHFDV